MRLILALLVAMAVVTTVFSVEPTHNMLMRSRGVRGSGTGELFYRKPKHRIIKGHNSSRLPRFQTRRPRRYSRPARLFTRKYRVNRPHRFSRPSEGHFKLRH